MDTGEMNDCITLMHNNDEKRYMGEQTGQSTALMEQFATWNGDI